MYEPLIEVLRDARLILCRPDNDFNWSSWKDVHAALKEVDGILSRLESGDLPARLDIEILFGPTGDLQEVSLSSGWGEEFLELAARCDAEVGKAYADDES
jgi:hypothetical protein